MTVFPFQAERGVREVQLNNDETPPFRVPVGVYGHIMFKFEFFSCDFDFIWLWFKESGGSSGSHLWSTTKSEHFFGCSNAGDKFLSKCAFVSF